jgi:uncharacterized Zn-finger protein
MNNHVLTFFPYILSNGRLRPYTLCISFNFAPDFGTHVTVSTPHDGNGEVNIADRKASYKMEDSPAEVQGSPMGISLCRRRTRLKKEHICPQCSQSFKRAEHLTRHERSRILYSDVINTDRKEKPYSCPYCESYFSRDDLINRYVRTFHPGEPPVHKVKRRPGILKGKRVNGTPSNESIPNEINEEHLSQLCGFDLLAAISTLSSEPGPADIPASIEQTDVPVE